MAFLAGASSVRSPFSLAFPSRRRYDLPTVVKATAASSNSVSPHPLISSLRLAASAAVLLAATSPAIACTPSPPPPPALTATVSPDDAVQDDSESHPFEKLIVETAALSRFGGAEAALARLSAAGVGEHCARLLAAQALFVDGKVDQAIAAFEELAREDPSDYRPLFCQGVLYSVLGRAAESESMLERCQVIAGDKFVTNFAMPVSEAEPEAEPITEKTETEAEGETEAEAEAASVTEKIETEAEGEKL
ncbi:uncharacterized protein LOC124688063 [Lolium rigidum]|uniref:uncharacterized protein LOC124688063 n=1 Tax=Lolium rigidum TaxID=89674 RepID=UPI001F5CC364|nr:uncharacterized protein LOC124688063 [Lolium rigidum]